MTRYEDVKHLVNEIINSGDEAAIKELEKAVAAAESSR